MKKLIAVLVLAFCIGANFQTNAQEYRSCLGAKGGFGLAGGFGVGLDFKYLTTEDQALEGIFTANAHFMMLSALYMYNKRIGVSDFFWYAGGGLEGGTYFNEFSRSDRKYNKWDYSLGIAGLVGFEYVFPDFPMNICLDFKPSFRIDRHLINDKRPTGWYEAYIGIRFNLARF